jgi:hypothetical protein
MKFCLATLLTVGLVAGGCASKQPQPAFSEPPDPAKPATASKPANPTVSSNSAAKKPEAKSKLIVTPENMLVGLVATYNSAGRFVVLDFPVGKMPVTNQTLFVFRQGLKVGEVRITGPERDHNTVADLISGEAQKGDEVRDK